MAGWSVFALLMLGLIVMPFILWADPMESWVAGRDWTRLSPAAAAVLGAALLAADVVLPVPSSIVGAALGYRLGAWAGTLVGAVGLTTGCALGYALGRWAGPVALGRLVGPASLRRASLWSERHGLLALVLCRAVPVLAEASVIAVGSLRMPAARVLVVTGLANLGVGAAYAALGDAVTDAGQLLAAVALSLALPGAAMLAARLCERRWVKPPRSVPPAGADGLARDPP